MKGVRIIIFALIFILAIVFSYIIFTNSDSANNDDETTSTSGLPNDVETCVDMGGIWIMGQNDCVQADPDMDIEGYCNDMGGEYNDCVSACQYNSNADGCNDLPCLKVCSWPE